MSSPYGDLTAEELFGSASCELCGEILAVNADDVGEWYDPNETDLDVSKHVIAHEICARTRGLELA